MRGDPRAEPVEPRFLEQGLAALSIERVGMAPVQPYDPLGIVVMADDGKAHRAGGVKLVGRVARGQGEGAMFTRLDWARAAFVARLDIDPFPGTLNLVPDDAAAWSAVRATPGILIPAPDAKFCNARAWRVRLAGRVDGAIVVPEVAGYPDDKIEIIAAVGLRAALGLADGDVLALEVLS